MYVSALVVAGESTYIIDALLPRHWAPPPAGTPPAIVAKALDPAVSPVAILVPFLNIKIAHVLSPLALISPKLACIKILLDDEVGVIVADNPVIVAGLPVPLLVLNVSVFKPCTTCNTDPAGNCALVGTPEARLALVIWSIGITHLPLLSTRRSLASWCQSWLVVLLLRLPATGLILTDLPSGNQV